MAPPKKVKIGGLNQTLIAALSCLLGITVLFGLNKYLKHKSANDIKLIGNQFVHTVDNIGAEVVDTLKKLDSSKHKSCTPEALLLMRQTVFKSTYIKDLGMFDRDYLICTSSLGPLDVPYEGPKADFVGKLGAEIWANRRLILFEQNYEAIAIKLGRFSAVILPKYFRDIIPPAFEWEFIFDFNQKQKHILGQKGLYDTLSNSKNKSALQFKQCSEKIPYCVAINLSKDQFERQYFTGLLFSLVISILVCILVYIGLLIYIIKRYSLISRVIRGLRKKRFYATYQPIVDLSNQQIIGCEVLARHRDSQGSMSPEQFIPLIRRINKTWLFTEQMISHALSELSTEGLPADFKVNINFFPEDISNNNICKLKKLTSELTQRFRIGVEITEDKELEKDIATENLNSIKEQGFCIIVDDFGTGYSNLQQIKSFKCEVLKIDKSFVNEMEEGSIRSTLIPIIIRLAKQLNLQIVAEGIENKMQEKALLDAGVSFGQGWLFGKPMNVKSLSRLIVKSNQ